MSNPPAPGSPASNEPWIEITSSRDFPAFLAEQQISLAFTTYQAGKLFLLGRHPAGRLAVFERTFDRCMGLWADGQTLWMSSRCQLWRFENALRPGEMYQGHDRLYVPRAGYTTGDLDVHDVAVGAAGNVVFVATGFNCLAALSKRYSFTPLWKPPFVSKLAAEDRCHLNGLAMDEGRPRYVTAVSVSDVVDGWRDRRQDGGCVLELPDGQVVARGLSMPHSPRLYRGRLWLLNSGAALSAASIRQRASSRRPPSARDTCAGCASPAILRSWAFPGRGTTRPLAAWRWTKNWRGGGRRLAAGCTSSTCGRAIQPTGFGWRGWSANSTTWPSCRAPSGQWRLASKATRFIGPSLSAMRTICDLPRSLPFPSHSSVLVAMASGYGRVGGGK